MCCCFTSIRSPPAEARTRTGRLLPPAAVVLAAAVGAALDRRLCQEIGQAAGTAAALATQRGTLANQAGPAVGLPVSVGLPGLSTLARGVR